MQYEQRQRPAAEQAYQTGLARSLIGSLGADEAARCARRQRWDRVLGLVLAEAGIARTCAAIT